MGSMDLERRVRSLEAATRNIPSRFAGGGSAPAAVQQVPWLAIQVRAGQTLLSTPKKVFGIKRKSGTAKAAGYIYYPIRATASASITGGAVSAVSLSDNGECYTEVPAVTVSAPPAGGTQAVVAAALDATGGGIVSAAWVLACGSGYTSAPSVTFSAAPGGGTTATGTAVVKNGKVVAIQITNNGKGYTSAPSISFSGGGGAGATAACALRAKSITLSITEPGSGYTSAPTLTIDAPTGGVQPRPPCIDGGVVQTGTDWPDGIGFGKIRAGSLQGVYSVEEETVLVHDDRSLIGWTVVGDAEAGTSPPYDATGEVVGSWLASSVQISGQDDEAQAVISAFVPMVMAGEV